LLANFKHLAALVGREEDAKNVDGLVKKTFPKGFQGIDAKRPVGFYGAIDPDGNLMDTTAILLLPITDEKAFLGLLESFNRKANKEDDGGLYTLPVENSPFPVYFRFAHQYVYFTLRDKEALNTNKLLTPGKMFPAGQTQTLYASFRIDQIPNAFKQILITNAELRLADLQEQKPANENEVQRTSRVQTIKELSRLFTSLIKDGSEVAVRVEVKRQANELFAELTLAGKPGSDLAASIAALRPTKSLLAGMGSPNAAAHGRVHAALPEGLRQLFAKGLDEAFRQGLAKEPDKAKRARGEKLIKALASSYQSGELDAAADLRGPSANKHYTLVTAIKVKDGKAIEKALRDLLQDLPEAARARLQVDAESAGDIKIHRLDIQKDLDKEGRRVFGDNPLYFALRSDAVFLAGGEEGLKALQEALAATPQTAPPLQVEVALARLAPLVQPKKADPNAIAQKAFSGAGKDNDKVRLTLEGGQTLKLSLDMKLAVVRFFNLLDKAEKGGTE
jgi:hypothetical protein